MSNNLSEREKEFLLEHLGTTEVNKGKRSQNVNRVLSGNRFTILLLKVLSFVPVLFACVTLFFAGIGVYLYLALKNYLTNNKFSEIGLVNEGNVTQVLHPDVALVVNETIKVHSVLPWIILIVLVTGLALTLGSSILVKRVNSWCEKRVV